MAPRVAPQESATPGNALKKRTRILRRLARKLPWTRLAFSLVMREISGDHSGGETPVPIPNTAVKPTSADGTALATGWESRSLPGISLLSVARSEPGRIRNGAFPILLVLAHRSKS